MTFNAFTLGSVALMCLTAIIIVGMVLRAWTMTRHPTSAPLVLPHTDIHDTVEPQPDPEPEPEPLDALPTHPSVPPVWKVYNPRPDAPARSCTCHGDPLQVGQDVLWWTYPDSSVALFCTRTFPREPS